MSNNPEQIRTDIEQTRAALGQDVDALAEKVDPTKVVERQKDRVRDRVRNVRESIMGTPDEDAGSDSGALQQAGERAQDMAHQAGEAVQTLPDKISSGTRGNPLAAGLIAFGAGWLAASLIPASRTEQDAAEKVKDRAQPLVDEAKSVAQEAGEHLKPQAQQAAQAVKDTASQSVQNVKEEGQSHAQDLKDDSQRAARHVKDTASES
ncbi:DUF3618 domain-containing protein [Enteractinococcus coprophilus]|uniref:Uncharacterized protein DUF3618 n=1 Tax=Enteractinococcus coprophilus TaxID=1027633 RepID=A0A543AG54_9MICC|nr:DUF3618 domain-containing protein [Enteractinococcus coprophilus]TQL71547.1 uncharacterized protein DUF3618 [Enteractinococcus coprophilus]